MFENKQTLVSIVCFLFGSLLYIQTISFDFTLDDKLYVSHNTFVKQGWQGLEKVWTKDLLEGYELGSNANLLSGGRYRPLALSIHIVEEELYGNNPSFAHLLNALLNGLLAMVCFSFFRLIFKNSNNNVLLLSLLATLIFIAHPLHVEAIANIRNRDEMLSGIFGLSAIMLAVNYIKSQKSSALIGAILLFLLCFFSKESSVNYLVLLILVLWFKAYTNKERVKPLLIVGFAITAAFLAFMVLRYWATSNTGNVRESAELLNQVYLYASPIEKLSGILFVYGLMLKLLFWPHPLTHDYYPYHPFKNATELELGLAPYPQFTDLAVSIPLILISIVLAVGLYLVFKKNDFTSKLFTFCIALFFGSTLLYSNIFFEIGSFFNERFLFMASLIPAILFAYGLGSLYQKQKPLTIAIAVVLVLGFSVQSISRSKAWKSDDTLVLADVKVSNGSARANLVAAEACLNIHKNDSLPKDAFLEEGFSSILDQGQFYGERALSIYPEYLAPLDILANIYFEQGEHQKSFDTYLAYYSKNPVKRIENNLSFVINTVQGKGNVLASINMLLAYNKLVSDSVLKAQNFDKIAQLYGSDLGQLDSSIYYVEKAIGYDPKASYYQNLGVALAIGGNLKAALPKFLKALELGEETKQLLINIGLIYQSEGDLTKASQYFQKAEGLTQ